MSDGLINNIKLQITPNINKVIFVLFLKSKLKISVAKNIAKFSVNNIFVKLKVIMLKPLNIKKIEATLENLDLSDEYINKLVK